MKNNKLPEYILGIDGGGTKCKAIVVNADNQILGTGISGPGNPFQNIEQATENICLSATLALKEAGINEQLLPFIPAGLGLAGVNIPSVYQKMLHWSHPFQRIQLATDLHTACLGAHHSEEGAVIVIGTGSCGFVEVKGQQALIGGHGFPHGDKGSGAWLGFKAVEQVLLSEDGLVTKTQLTQLIKEALLVSSASQLIEQVANKPASFYAKLAKLVILAATQKDPIAHAILLDGAAYISALARKLLEKQPSRISVIGGLSVPLTPWLDNDIQTQLSPPLSPPEMGAVLLARKVESQKAQPIIKG